MKKICIKLMTLGLAICFFLSGCNHSKNLVSNENKVKKTSEETFKETYNALAKVGKERKSLICDASYIIGADERSETIQFLYRSNDATQGVLIKLSKSGKIDVVVRVESMDVAVVGNAEVKASEYCYGYKFEDFEYKSQQTQWDYEKFKIRANAYVRDTFLYVDEMLHDNLGINLKDLGFKRWKKPKFNFSKGGIFSSDIGGMWDYKSKNPNEYSSKLYLIFDSVYWRGYEEQYEKLITAKTMIQSNDFLLGSGMEISLYDECTGEIIVYDNYTDQKNGNVIESYRRYIYRDSDGRLKMRVESVNMGLKSSEDGKIYEKVADETAFVNPDIHWKYADMDTNDEKVLRDESSEQGDDIAKNAQANLDEDEYESILEAYRKIMKNALSDLLKEFATEASKISEVSRLADLANAKVEKLAELCNEGIGKMASLMYAKNDKYETYEEWVQKLYSYYSDFATEIYNEYTDACIN